MSIKPVDALDNLDGPHTLSELAEHVALRTYRYWLKTAELLAPSLFENPSNLDSGFEWTADGGLSIHGPRWRRRREINGRRERLFERISDRIRDALASPRYTVTGIGPAGTSLDVPRDRAKQIAVDLDGNTLSTQDGGFVWRAITIRTTTPAAVVAPKRRAGAKSSKREAVKGYVLQNFPGGVVPHDVKNEAIAAANRCHEKTVRRALIEMGQDPDR
jgi:hypothetical protein